MIGICPKCGNHEWNKEISQDKKQVICHNCGDLWNYKSFPLFILTGCSGVGKTTTLQELQQRDTRFIVMDADILYNIMPHETEEDLHNWVEQIMVFSRNLMQSGKPLLWSMAGALDKFENTYNRKFFSDIHYLALVCNSEDLEKRMREGRHITDVNWIKGSMDYNRWFIEVGTLFNQKIDTYDITGKSVSEVADYVNDWINARL